MAQIQEANFDIPKKGRLAYIEQLMADDVIGWRPNKVIISQSEQLEIACEVKDTIKSELGIVIPDYQIKFASKAKLGGAAGDTCPISGTITLPSRGQISVPLTIAHEQAHAYHVENSEAWIELKAIYNEQNLQPYRESLNKAPLLIEGWAMLIEVLYAKIRDRKFTDSIIFRSVYQDMVSGTLDYFQRFDDLSFLLNRKHATNKRYYYGFRIFQQIFQREGIEGAIEAANTLTTNEQLFKYAQAKSPSP